MEKIGFIGLGIMGKPMAHHLLKAGYPVSVLEKNKASGELVKAGARSSVTAREIAEHSDIVITMLPDSPQVEEVVLGKDGVKEGLKEGGLFIDMSSIAQPLQKKSSLVTAKKNEAVDAPVSGGQVGAEATTLSINVEEMSCF